MSQSEIRAENVCRNCRARAAKRSRVHSRTLRNPAATLGKSPPTRTAAPCRTAAKTRDRPDTGCGLPSSTRAAAVIRDPWGPVGRSRPSATRGQNAHATRNGRDAFSIRDENARDAKPNRGPRLPPPFHADAPKAGGHSTTRGTQAGRSKIEPTLRRARLWRIWSTSNDGAGRRNRNPRCLDI